MRWLVTRRRIGREHLTLPNALIGDETYVRVDVFAPDFQHCHILISSLDEERDEGIAAKELMRLVQRHDPAAELHVGKVQDYQTGREEDPEPFIALMNGARR